ncbi:MAG: phosphoglycolate phosphatase [Pseudomonadota bacterium]
MIRNQTPPGFIMFDLDGTLIDSAPDLATSTNELLEAAGLPALTIDQVRSMIGNGIRMLVYRAFGAYGIDLEGDALTDATDRMMTIYARNLTLETVLMPGAERTMRELHAIGVTLAVITNKPEAFTREILEFFDLDRFVSIVVGGDTGPKRKPAPDMLLHALRLAGADPSDALMIGDSPADIDAAKAAGIANIAVRGGYTNVAVEALGADTIIDSLEDLTIAFSQLRKAV